MCEGNPITSDEINKARDLWKLIITNGHDLSTLFADIEVTSPKDEHKVLGPNNKLWIIPIYLGKMSASSLHYQAFRDMIEEMEAVIRKNDFFDN